MLPHGLKLSLENALRKINITSVFKHSQSSLGLVSFWNMYQYFCKWFLYNIILQHCNLACRSHLKIALHEIELVTMKPGLLTWLSMLSFVVQSVFCTVFLCPDERQAVRCFWVSGKDWEGCGLWKHQLKGLKSLTGVVHQETVPGSELTASLGLIRHHSCQLWQVYSTVNKPLAGKYSSLFPFLCACRFMVCSVFHHWL